jgi:hypothetical protein
MRHYNLLLISGKHVCREGLDLPDDEAARKEAQLVACDLRDDPGEGDWSGWTIRVTDETGRHVTSVSIGHRSKLLGLFSGLGQRLADFRHAVHRSRA